MEFTSSQIARLVLGYLKTEKCQLAFDSFYKNSPHFQCSNNTKIRSKYIVTRMLGYSLRDVLNDYAQVYNLIQERLEPTEYYEENSSRNIVDQLRYLLDRGSSTRQSTPHGSRSSTPTKEGTKKCLFNQNLSIIEEHVTDDLNATPLEALPGNSHEFNNTPRRKGGIKTNKNTAVEQSDSGDSPDNCQDDGDDMEVLRQTFLEHTELHEKIAENINLVINTGETTKTAEEKLASELDIAIKAIVQRTEADPMFEKLIGDLIGSTSDNDVGQEIQQCHDSAPEKREQLASDTRKTSSKELEAENDSIKQCLRSAKKSSSDICTEGTSDTNTNIKISSKEDIGANQNIQKNVNTKQVDAAKVNFHQNLTVNTNAGDIILYDGTLENYMKNTTTPVVSQANPLLFNNNLLMVQPGLIQQTPVSTPLVTGLQVDKPLYVLNSSQLYNVSVPQYKINNVPDQDILTMPTVILCDDNRQTLITQPPATTSYSREPTRILPKETPESSLSEYLTLYKSSEQPILQSESKPQLKKKDPTSNSIQIEILKKAKHAEKCTIKQEDAKIVPEQKVVSPRAVTPEGIKQNNRKTTPKSGSHIRALDFNFNTPGHKSLSAKKTHTTPKSSKKKSPAKVSSTKISKSLFGSPLKNVKTENEAPETNVNEDKPIKKEQKQKKNSSWDADLRALMGPVKDPTPKKKKKESGKRLPKKPKLNLNKTETDAQIIEENLREMDLDVNPSSDLVSDIKEVKKEENKNEEDTKQDNDEAQEEVKVANEDDQISEFTVTLINCNAKSRFRKKCNIDNNISKSVKITKVKEIKSLELVPDTNNKLILSPSKLNANKRTLVDNIDKEIITVVTDTEKPITEFAKEIKVENKKDVKQEAPETSNTAIKDVVENSEQHTDKSLENKSTVKDSKFITPEMPMNSTVHPISANRNLTPMLETPIKVNTIPNTPGKYLQAEINDSTPMTKLLNEQLHGVDILSIPTPSFPLTPSFPFTPYNTRSPYPNRSTDYSTTSSYYQPSDSEQNKSYEALVEECKRLEAVDFKAESVIKEKENKETEVKIEASISQKISCFNQNLIATKNLNLVKKDLENSSCESSSSDGESSTYSGDDTDSSDSFLNKSGNATVVEKRVESSRYSLRPRKKEETNTNFGELETIQDIVTQTEIKPELNENSAVSAKDAILKEIEEKRKRTIAKIKQVEKPPPSIVKKKQRVEKTPRRQTTEKKPLPNRNSLGKFIKNTPQRKSAKNKRKSKSPVKLAQKSSTKTIISDNSKDVLLHISSDDDDDIKPFDVVETELLEDSLSANSDPLNTFKKALHSMKLNLKTKETCDNPLDQEAAILVEGLKERGIYLVPNKSPRKQARPSHVNVIDSSVNCDKNDDIGETTKLNEQNLHHQNTKKIIEIKPDESKDRNFSSIKSDSNKIENLENISKSKSATESAVLKPIDKSNIKICSNETNSESTKIDTKTPSTSSTNDAITKKNKKPKKDKIIKDESKPETVTDNLKNEMIKSKVASNSLLKENKILSGDFNEKDLKSNSSNKNMKSSKSTSKISSNQSKKIDTKRSTTGHQSAKLESSSKNKKSNKNDDQKPKVLSTKSDTLKDSQNVSSIKSSENSEKICTSTEKLSPDIEQDLNLTDSLIDEVFDDKIFTEETVKIVYDPSKTCGKTLADYDLPISNNCLEVEVFGQQIEMSITPFEMVLDIPVKKSNDKVKILQNTLISPSSNKCSPLTSLYKKFNQSEIKTNSPLEDLYSSSSVRYPSTKIQTLKRNDRRRNSVDQNYESRSKSKRSTRSKSVDYSSLLSEYKDIQIADKEDKLQKVTDITEVKISDTSTLNEEIRDVHRITKTPKPSPRDIDDDLMNYAICGSERVENDADDTLRPNKRKAKDDEDDTSTKKLKHQDLLKTIDVDMFLTQLHGNN